MNYSPQVGCNIRGPQQHLYLPFYDSPWGPQPCPPQMSDKNPSAPDKGALPAPPAPPPPRPPPFMSGALPVGPQPNPNAYAYACAGAGVGPPPGRPGPDQLYYPNPIPPYPQGANVNIRVNGFDAGCYGPPQFGSQPINHPIPVQAANGQWLAGPYNRVPVGYGVSSVPQYAHAGYGPLPATVPEGPLGQGGSIWTGPTQSQHMQNLLLRADRRPVGICPADPDPWRFYLVRELDGGTTSRNRYTIDSGQIGSVEWYQAADGSMYAVIVAPPKSDKKDEGNKKD